MVELNDMIGGFLNPDEQNHSLHSLVIPNHLRQMFMFGRRKGVELYAKQDVNGMRQAFIERQWNYNKIPLYEKAIWHIFTARGNLLFYFFKDEFGNYPLRFLGEENYRTFYSPYGNLEKVILIYPFKVQSDDYTQSFSIEGRTVWIKITIQKDYIYEERFNYRPDLETQIHASGQNKKTYYNSFGFVPCVEINYNSHGVGQKGRSDFELIKTQLENLEALEYAMSDNLTMFAGTTLITSLEVGQVMEGVSGYSSNYHRQWEQNKQKGWRRAGIDSYGLNNSFDNLTKGSMASALMGEERRVKRIIGGMGEQDRIAFLTPDPITPDHHRHLLEKREQAHNALGGLDELGLSANATAYEMRTMFGKVETTALLMAEHIYTYGLCLVFEMMIHAEEMSYMINLAEALKKEPNEITLDLIAELREKEKLPMVDGLEPIGNKEIKWRYKGDVFTRDSREILDDSIVARNLQEMGVNSFEAMRHLFPDKTDRELEDVLAGGYPFRYIGAICSQIQQLLGIYGNSLQLPHNENPEIPLAADVQIGNLLRRSLDTIFKELSYATNYESANAGNYFPEQSSPRATELPNESTDSESTDGKSTVGSVFSEPDYAGGLRSLGGWHPYSPEFSASRHAYSNLPTAGSISQPTVGSSLPTEQPIDIRFNSFPSAGSTLSSSSSGVLPTNVSTESGFIPNSLGRSIYGDSTYESTDKRTPRQKRTNRTSKNNRK